MPYKVEADWSPVYELQQSLMAFLQYRRYAKVLEAGADWANSIMGRGGREIAEAIEAAGDCVGELDLLIWQCPQKDDLRKALDWIAGLSPGEVYERVIPYLAGGNAGVESAKVLAVRDHMVEFLRAWDRAYFAGVDPAVTAGLALEALKESESLRSTSPEDGVEDATGGVRLDPTSSSRRIVLVPQHHFRPVITYTVYKDLAFYHYPVDVVPPHPGAPSAALLRLTRALSDESRLKILRYLASGERGFTDVVKFSGLAKSTVHHHLLTLRASGLIRVHASLEGGPDRYSFRPEAVEKMKASLSGYVKGEQ